MAKVAVNSLRSANGLPSGPPWPLGAEGAPAGGVVRAVVAGPAAMQPAISPAMNIAASFQVFMRSSEDGQGWGASRPAPP